MNATKLFALTIFAGFAAFSAHADEADASQYSIQFNSTRSAADVRMEATAPVRISNGGTGYIGLTQSAVSAASVKAEAIAAARSGQTTRGEIGPM